MHQWLANFKPALKHANVSFLKGTFCWLPLTLYIGWTAGSWRRVAIQITSTTKCVRSRCDNTWKTWNSAWRTHILANNQARGGSLGRNMGVSLSGFCSSWKKGSITISHSSHFSVCHCQSIPGCTPHNVTQTEKRYKDVTGVVPFHKVLICFFKVPNMHHLGVNKVLLRNYCPSESTFFESVLWTYQQNSCLQLLHINFYGIEICVCPRFISYYY